MQPIKSKLQFETLLSDLTAGFDNLLKDQIHKEILDGQRKVCEFLGLDGSILVELSIENVFSKPTHYWSNDEKSVFLSHSHFMTNEFSYSVKKILCGEMIIFSNPEELPEHAVHERKYFLDSGLISCVSVPLQAGNEVIGAMSWESRSVEFHWSAEMLNRIELVSTAFANIIALRSVKVALQERLQFERLLTDLSATLVSASDLEIQEKIVWGLNRIGEFLEIDRIGIKEFSSEDFQFKTTHLWQTQREKEFYPDFLSLEFPWAFKKLRRGEVIKFSRVSDLPHEADLEKKMALKAKIKSSIVVPLMVGEELLGMLALTTTRYERAWPEKLVSPLRLVGEIIASFLHRNRVHKVLDERLQFEKLLVDLSARFINLPMEKLDNEIREGMRIFAEFLECRDVSFWKFPDEGGMQLMLAWTDEDVERSPLEISGEVFFTWVVKTLREGNVIRVSRPDDIPKETNFAREFGSATFHSVLAVPLIVEGKAAYALCIRSFPGKRSWPEYVVKRTQLLGQIFANTVQRKLADMNLLEAERRYRTVADFTYDWEYWTRPDGTLSYVSPACMRISGYAPREFVDNPSLFQEIIMPEDKHTWTEPELGFFKGLESRELQFRIQKRDGQICWIENVCRPVIDNGNEFLGFRGSNRDITMRKQSELDLRSAFSQINRLKEQFEAENIYLRQEVKLEHQHDTVIGQSGAIRDVLSRVELVAGTDATVLITGETGTGKELIARAIHDLSSRKDRVMVTVNCSALPSNLVESELFGREKGAYTGALSKQVGRFEVANGSTIFLDEIGELPRELQAKLLRVLQDGKFERLGSPKTVNVNVRVISATNRDLAAAVKEGSFREDLFYRLNVFPILVPPLRKRPEDIEKLVWFFARGYGQRMGREIEIISRGTMEKLKRYPWPGNIRELKNIVERAVIISKGPQLHVEVPKLEDESKLHAKTLTEIEREHIVNILEMTAGRVSGEKGAAKFLNINPKTLESKMKKLGISRENVLPDI